jgi:hypothetical protein
MCIVDANKNRDGAIVDIPNAFVQSIVEDEKYKVLIRIRGPLVDILVSITPNVYRPWVKSNSLLNVWLIYMALWWHCYNTSTRSLSRVWSLRVTPMIPVWQTSKRMGSNWLCVFTWTIVRYASYFKSCWQDDSVANIRIQECVRRWDQTNEGPSRQNSEVLGYVIRFQSPQTGSHPSWSSFLLYCNVSKLYLCLELVYLKY